MGRLIQGDIARIGVVSIEIERTGNANVIYKCLKFCVHCRAG
jgi:hypothetical protein